VLYLTEPDGSSTPRITADGAALVANERVGDMRVVRLRPRAGGVVRWAIRYP
jgi:hypothetical protein